VSLVDRAVRPRDRPAPRHPDARGVRSSEGAAIGAQRLAIIDIAHGDLAKPVLEADSHAKVAMRKKVRGLRTIEQAVLQRPKAETQADLTPKTPEATGTATAAANPPPAGVDPVGSVVLDYCAAVRGILNDDQGGPLHPPGLRMAEALNEVDESLQRNLGAKKGGSRRSNSAGSRDASGRASTKSRSSRRSSENTSR